MFLMLQRQKVLIEILFKLFRILRGKIPCSTNWLADLLTRSLTFNAVKKVLKTLEIAIAMKLSHSLFLSIVNGLESTMALGGETLVSFGSITL